MPKIKLIKVHDVRNSCDYCDHYVKDSVADDMSTWQEVSDAELNWLQRWEGRNYLNKKNVSIVILEDITNKETVDGFIDDIKKFVKDQAIKEEQRKIKQIEAENKRKLATEQRKIEKAIKLLEKNGIKNQH
jgi:hypothetical protein